MEKAKEAFITSIDKAQSRFKKNSPDPPQIALAP